MPAGWGLGGWGTEPWGSAYPVAPLDAFDALLNSTCSILSRQAGAKNTYGQTPRTLAVLQSDVPCRVSRLTGDEEKGNKEFSINKRKIYMRPWAISSIGDPFSPRSQSEASGATELNPKMWITVGNVKYDILEAANPSLQFHHYEVLVEQVIS